MHIPLEISTPCHEGVLFVSKSRKLPVLLSIEEMESLLNHLGPIWMFDASRPLPLNSLEIQKEEFLSAYRKYIEGIQRKKLIDEKLLHPFFSSIITCDLNCVYAQKVSGGRYLIKVRKPCIQLQRHHFVYSKSFHLGVMGKESVTWGIQFSYPHLYMDPKTKAIGKVAKNSTFLNTERFHRFSKWIRSNTRATPYVINNNLTNQPMRLGLSCFSWINRHPGLIQRGLRVDISSSS